MTYPSDMIHQWWMEYQSSEMALSLNVLLNSLGKVSDNRELFVSMPKFMICSQSEFSYVCAQSWPGNSIECHKEMVYCLSCWRWSLTRTYGMNVHCHVLTYMWIGLNEDKDWSGQRFLCYPWSCKWNPMLYNHKQALSIWWRPSHWWSCWKWLPRIVPSGGAVTHVLVLSQRPGLHSDLWCCLVWSSSTPCDHVFYFIPLGASVSSLACMLYW